MKDTYNDGYKTEDIKCIIVDFIAEDGKGGFPIMRQGTYVLCKDCKYFKFGNGCRLQSVDYDWEEQMYADDFCSRGERKDD